MAQWIFHCSCAQGSGDIARPTPSGGSKDPQRFRRVTLCQRNPLLKGINAYLMRVDILDQGENGGQSGGMFRQLVREPLDRLKRAALADGFLDVCYKL